MYLAALLDKKYVEFWDFASDSFYVKQLAQEVVFSLFTFSLKMMTKREKKVTTVKLIWYDQ